MKKFYLVWDDSRHKLGIASIDRQHRGLMDLVNELSEEVEHGCDYARVRQKIEQILRFTEDHFAHEEELMRQHDFPGLAQHVVEHGKLLEEISTLLETLTPDNTNRALLVTAFLTDCAENHILSEDRALTQYLRGKGLS